MKRILAVMTILLGACLPALADSAVPVQTFDNLYVAQDLQGDVRVLRNGETDAVQLHEGDTLKEGDQVTVGEDSEASLTLADDQVIRLDVGTKVTLDRFQDNLKGGFLTRFQVAAGNLFAEVKHLMDRKSTFEVDSGGVICGVRGTIFEVSNDDGQVQLQTHEGDVEAVGTGQHVKAGQCGEFAAGKFLRRRALRAAERNRLANWVKFRALIHEKRLMRRQHRLNEFKANRLKALRAKLRRAKARQIHRRALLRGHR